MLQRLRGKLARDEVSEGLQNVRRPEVLCSPSKRDGSQRLFLAPAILNSEPPSLRRSSYPVNLACQIVIHAWLYLLDPFRKVCFLPCSFLWTTV